MSSNIFKTIALTAIGSACLFASVIPASAKGVAHRSLKNVSNIAQPQLVDVAVIEPLPPLAATTPKAHTKAHATRALVRATKMKTTARIGSPRQPKRVERVKKTLGASRLVARTKVKGVKKTVKRHRSTSKKIARNALKTTVSD